MRASFQTNINWKRIGRNCEAVRIFKTIAENLENYWMIQTNANVDIRELKGGPYYCYSAYVLPISRYSGFPTGDAFKYSDIFVQFKTIRRKKICETTIGIKKENMG